jgi:hypothetical protein
MRLPLRPAALVHAWFDMLPPSQLATTRALYTLVTATAPQFGQAVKWGHLVFTAGGLNALAIAPHNGSLHLQVFRGAELVQRFPGLEGQSRGLRQLRMRYGQPIDEALVTALVRAVVVLMPEGDGRQR